MKKLLLVLTVFCFFTLNLQAQEVNDFIKNKTTFGIKGGYNASYFYSSDISNIFDSDIYVGLFSDTRLSNKWSFQNELLYSSAFGHRFIEVPLVLKYHITDKWIVFAGPSLDFSINNDKNIDGRQVEPIGLSMVIGTQYNLSKRFFIEGRANFAITNQINTPFNTINTSFFRNTFRIGIGYRF